LKEILTGFDTSSWYGIEAPKSKPLETITRLNSEINAAVGDPRLPETIIAHWQHPDYQQNNLQKSNYRLAFFARQSKVIAPLWTNAAIPLLGG